MKIAAKDIAVWLERWDSAGLDLDVPSILDALWMTGIGVQLPRKQAATAAASPAEEEAPKTKEPKQGIEPPPKQQVEQRVEEASSTEVFQKGATGQTGNAKASSVTVPAAPAISDTLSLSRALRPLRTRRRSQHRQELDEEATVQATAERRSQITPVFRATLEPWYEAAVVVEQDSAMEVFRDTVDGFARLLERTGAFKDVRLWQLEMDEGNQQARLRGASGAVVRTSFLAAAQPKRLILLVTHGVSPHWLDGRYAEVLQLWAKHTCVLLVQLLPRRLWKLTALGEPTSLVQTLAPGRLTADLEKLPLAWLRGLPPEKERVTVPMASLEAETLSAWARMQMGMGKRAPAMVLDRRLRPVASPSATPGEASEEEWEQRVGFFRSYASLPAWNIAVALSAVAFTIPLARVVQHARLGGEANHIHLAEVMLSGLVQRRKPVTTGAAPNEVLYEFAPRAKAILQRSMREADRKDLAAGFEAAVSKYLAKRLGAPIRFAALVRNKDGKFELPDYARPFAELGTQLLGIAGTAGTGTAEAETRASALPGVWLVEQFLAEMNPPYHNLAADLAGVMLYYRPATALAPRLADQVTMIRYRGDDAPDLWEVLRKARLLNLREDGYWTFVPGAAERLAELIPDKDAFVAKMQNGFAEFVSYVPSRRVVHASGDTPASLTERRELMASADVVFLHTDLGSQWNVQEAERFHCTVVEQGHYRSADEVPLRPRPAFMEGVPLPPPTPLPRLDELVHSILSPDRSVLMIDAAITAGTELVSQALWGRRVREAFRRIEWVVGNASITPNAETLVAVIDRTAPFVEYPGGNVILIRPAAEVYANMGVRLFGGVSSVGEAQSLPEGELLQILGVLSVLDGQVDPAPFVGAQSVAELREHHFVEFHEDGSWFLPNVSWHHQLAAHPDRAQWHEAVLNRYTFPRGANWRQLPEDGYIDRHHLFTHLIAAGRAAEARAIALDGNWWQRFRKKGWPVGDALAALGELSRDVRIQEAAGITRSVWVDIDSVPADVLALLQRETGYDWHFGSARADLVDIPTYVFAGSSAPIRSSIEHNVPLVQVDLEVPAQKAAEMALSHLRSVLDRKIPVPTWEQILTRTLQFLAGYQGMTVPAGLVKDYERFPHLRVWADLLPLDFSQEQQMQDAAMAMMLFRFLARPTEPVARKLLVFGDSERLRGENLYLRWLARETFARVLSESKKFRLEVPSWLLQDSVLIAFAPVEKLASRYDELRRKQRSGQRRTAAMHKSFDAMLARTVMLADGQLRALLNDPSGGYRLFAFAKLQSRPTPENLEAVVAALSKPEMEGFTAYGGILALEEMLRSDSLQLLDAQRARLAAYQAQLPADSERRGMISRLIEEHPALAERSEKKPLPERLAAVMDQTTDPRLGGHEWVVIPESKAYWIGAQKTDPKGPNYDEEAFEDETLRKVDLPAFRIGKYPVTVAQYRWFVEEGRVSKREPRDRKPTDWLAQLEHPNRPVVGVSWKQATAYAVWVGARIPSEEEWERAARGPKGTMWPWGNEDIDSTRANYGESEIGHPTPVGLYPSGASAEGVLDLVGNVWEWTSSEYRKNSGLYVCRGGSFDVTRWYARPAFRNFGLPLELNQILGFRLAWGIR